MRFIASVSTGLEDMGMASFSPADTELLPTPIGPLIITKEGIITLYNYKRALITMLCNCCHRATLPS
jgi:hypothetical protein